MQALNMEVPQVFIPFTPIPHGKDSPKMSDPKERFFRHFQADVTSKFVIALELINIKCVCILIDTPSYPRPDRRPSNDIGHQRRAERLYRHNISRHLSAE